VHCSFKGLVPVNKNAKSADVNETSFKDNFKLYLGFHVSRPEIRRSNCTKYYKIWNARTWRS